MKYKVMFSVSSTTGNRGVGNAEFYVYNEAVAACQQWVQLGAPHVAYLWNGEDWTTYAPIP